MNEIYKLNMKSATDVDILRLTAGCEWDSLQRLMDGGLVYVGAVPLCPPALLFGVRNEKVFCSAYDDYSTAQCG